jgi:urease accessory protein UreE
MLLINDVKLSMLPKNDKFVIIYDNVRRAMMEQYGKTIVLDFPIKG